MDKHSDIWYLNFPPVTEFPQYQPKDSAIALVIRLWCPHDGRACRIVNLVAWCMRAWILNSDLQKYNVQPIVHVKPDFYLEARRLLLRQSIPDDWIRPWEPKEILITETSWGNNACPILIGGITSWWLLRISTRCEYRSRIGSC